MLRTLTVLLVVLSCTVATAWADSAAGHVSMHFDLSGQQAGEEVKLWIPYPVSDQAQLISNLSYRGDYTSAAVYTDRVNAVPMLQVIWDKSKRSRTLSFDFDVQRDEVLHRDLPVDEAPWNRVDFARYLAPSSRGPIDGAVKALAERITRGKSTVLQKARAIYDWTVENMFRDPRTLGCGEGDVCLLLAAPGGKCADIHSVYVSLARAAGVPAREVFGLRLGRKDGDDITHWQHCWAEFYLPGYGWVPVDAADVLKMMLKHDLKLEDAETAAYRSYFWGGIDAYRVKLSNGRDLVLPGASGGPVNYLMYPYAEIGGQAIDWLAPETFKYRITFTQK